MKVEYTNATRHDAAPYLNWSDPCTAHFPDTPLFRDERYKELTLLHFEYLHQIRRLYRFMSSDDLELFLSYCYQDLTLVPEMRAAEFFYEVNFDSFETYRLLALTLERWGRYEEAITVCEHAIAFGYDNDETKGRMKGRIERLRRKLNKYRR